MDFINFCFESIVKELLVGLIHFILGRFLAFSAHIFEVLHLAGRRIFKILLLFSDHCHLMLEPLFQIRLKPIFEYLVFTLAGYLRCHNRESIVLCWRTWFILFFLLLF